MVDGLKTGPVSSSFSALPTSTTISASQSASGWFNYTAFAWVANVTRYAPMLEDLVSAGPRIVTKLGSYMATGLDAVEGGAMQRGSPPEGLGADVLPGLATDVDLSSIIDGNSYATVNAQDEIAEASRLPLDGARGLGNLFNYATSRWAIACVVMAIVLNRTYIFAAPRRRLRLRWQVRLLLRLIPVIILVSQAIQLLQSIQCQTSPKYPQMRWGSTKKGTDLTPSHVNGFLNSLSSMILLGAFDEQSCKAVGMIPANDPHASSQLRGSLSRLWPLFGTFCLSQFVDTVSCAVQGRAVATETGMSLFEQSLAFAEVDVAVSNRFNLGPFSKPSPQASAGSAAVTLTRSMILRRVNTPPEVLLIAFLSTMTHITSHVLGIFDLQAKYRLVNTGIWGLCFMGSIVWSAVSFDPENPASQGLLRFPTACIIRFAPHVLVSLGIIICFVIYGLALLLSALAPPANVERSRMSLWQRIGFAHENMQANISLSEVQITREMDFYTALLRAGFGAITMASEAVYLNEDGGVNLKRHTWLEEARFREAEELQRQWIGMGLPDARYDQIGAIGLIPVKEGPIGASNGYGRERAAQKVPRGRADRSLRIGIGASERSSRWMLALEILLSINKLLARVIALSILWFLGVLRIRRRPALLIWLARNSKRPTNESIDAVDAASTATSSDASRAPNQRATPGMSDDMTDRRPHTYYMDDVEAEFRRVGEKNDEENLDNDLYNYWLTGGWWGSKDTSGDFEPVAEDDEWDATSVITMTTDTNNMDQTDVRSGADSEWSSEDESQRTPTQRSPGRTRETTPVVDTPIGMRDLARLLQPSKPEDREEAERLAAHLLSDRILTRSGFRRMEKLQRTRILTMPGPSVTPRKKPGEPTGRVVKLSPEEEEQLLEQLLLTRRQTATESEANPIQASAVSDGDGPPCVVCQCSPRTVIVWPCRCLSLCDDCRVSLAMNNFDKCVCCRRDVMSFSRIYVP